MIENGNKIKIYWSNGEFTFGIVISMPKFAGDLIQIKEFNNDIIAINPYSSLFVALEKKETGSESKQ